MKEIYNQLAYDHLNDFLYGSAPRPIVCKNGMVIGGGLVYPEINFTLPPMDIRKDTMPDVLKQYQEMISGVLARALDLHTPGVVVEVELLPPMTINPEWGIDVTKTVRDIMFDFEANKGLKSVLRLTPNDTREHIRPPMLRSGDLLENMLATFEGAAKAGADFLSVESTGGKEIHDDALINADLPAVLFSLGVLAVRDMHFLWGHIVDIAKQNGCMAAGDSACGFGNTAMVLADRGMIPRVFAAVVRVATIQRSLAAFEMGAVGPSKDCAYEGPFLKAIAGIPLAMEGKSSACAHLSPVGNIAAAVCDLWSNESVQNVKLLSAMAPVVSMEQLVYDCRLMNGAAKEGPQSALLLQKWLSDSDSTFDPQAYILRPDVVYEICSRIVHETDPLKRTLLSAQTAIDVLTRAMEQNKVSIAPRELKWLDLMQAQLKDIPGEADAFFAKVKPLLDDSKFIPAEYGL